MTELDFVRLFIKTLEKISEPYIGKAVDRHGELVPAILYPQRKLRQIESCEIRVNFLNHFVKKDGSKFSLGLTFYSKDTHTESEITEIAELILTRFEPAVLNELTEGQVKIDKINLQNASSFVTKESTQVVTRITIDFKFSPPLFTKQMYPIDMTTLFRQVLEE